LKDYAVSMVDAIHVLKPYSPRKTNGAVVDSSQYPSLNFDGINDLIHQGKV
jgi:hypothetical protein